MSATKAIDVGDLVPMDVFAALGEPISIDLVYADATHPENIFGIAAYHPQSRLTLHKSLATVVLRVARELHKAHGWTLVLKDGLRVTEAQQILIDTDIVKANPHWLQEPRLLSSPGQGAHPRAMAIDVSCLDSKAQKVDMGTVFDEMTDQSARACTGFIPAILENRKHLELAFTAAGEASGVPILPLPSEWWDFRIPASQSGQFLPLSDKDLPAPLRMTTAPETGEQDEARYLSLAKDILSYL